MSGNSKQNITTKLVIKSKNRTFSPDAIFIDLDGTLFDKLTKKASRKNINTIRKYGQQTNIIISTGRSFSNKVKKTMNDLRIKYAICQNGAIVADNKGNILQNITLDENQIQEVINIVKKYNLGFTINSQFLIYSNHWFWKLFRILWKNKWKKIGKFNLQNTKVNKIVIAGYFRRKKIWDLAQIISNTIKGLSVKTSGQDRIIEITNDEATKGHGAEFISQLLKINIKNTIHIGDSENDTTTLGKVGALIAMKDGSTKLLEIATHIAPKHKRSGLAKALEGNISEINNN